VAPPQRRADARLEELMLEFAAGLFVGVALIVAVVAYLIVLVIDDIFK
jgi:hypothetical protein